MQNKKNSSILGKSKKTLDPQINERLQTEQSQRKSEDRYRDIFETSTIAIAELDFSLMFKEFDKMGLKNIEKVKDHLSNHPKFLNKIIKEIRVLDANQAVLDLFEATNIHEIQTFHDLMGEIRSQRDYRGLLDTLTNQKPFYEGETKIITKKGNSKTIYFHMPLPHRGENISNVFLNMFDISSRIQIEEELKRKLQEITALHGIATASSESTSVDELIERTTQLLGETLYPDNFGLLIVDENLQTICPHPSYRGISTAALKLVEPIHKGITGRAVRTGLPQRVSQVKKDKDYIQIKTDTLSELVVPIKINGKTIGVVNTESTLENAYSETDENFLLTFSNQLAISIERMHLLEAQLRQTREITALYETAISISGLLDTEKLINRVYLQVSDLFPLDSFLLAFNEEETKEIHIATAMEENRVLAELIDQRLPIQNSGLIGWVIQNQKTLLIGDLKTDPLPVKPIHANKPVRSWLGVPLITRGKTIGAISIQSFNQYTYNDNHSRLLESMAAQIATSLENALLVEQTQNRLQRLSALHDIDLVINSSLDLRVTMNILLDQVIEKLNVDAASVMLLNTKTQLLEFAAGRGFRTRKIEEYRLRLGEGISGQAAMERHLVQSLNLSELDENSAYPTLLSEEGFISYYSVPLIAKGQVKGVLDIFNRTLISPDQEWVNFLETLAGQAAIAIDNTTLLEDLHRSNIELTMAYDTTLEGWSHALDLRDKETEGHTQRVVNLTLKIARGLGMVESELIHLRRGALLHDIGKMGIPDEILFKPGPLSNEEWIIMRRHPLMAYELLHPIIHLRPSIDIPYCHHEKWDGGGYPRGLNGDLIPLGARIFSVVDVWDALTSDRPYRKAWPAQRALDFIKEQKGIQFDPKVVELFMILVKNELSDQ
jgi:HD-GYP domain-containing protein (c-di-GMP phosphodiesterase class II)/PAS domain-containing protein